MNLKKTKELIHDLNNEFTILLSEMELKCMDNEDHAKCLARVRGCKQTLKKLGKEIELCFIIS